MNLIEIIIFSRIIKGTVNCFLKRNSIFSCATLWHCRVEIDFHGTKGIKTHIFKWCTEPRKSPGIHTMPTCIIIRNTRCHLWFRSVYQVIRTERMVTSVGWVWWGLVTNTRNGKVREQKGRLLLCFVRFNLTYFSRCG